MFKCRLVDEKVGWYLWKHNISKINKKIRGCVVTKNLPDQEVNMCTVNYLLGVVYWVGTTNDNDRKWSFCCVTPFTFQWERVVELDFHVLDVPRTTLDKAISHKFVAEHNWRCAKRLERGVEVLSKDLTLLSKELKTVRETLAHEKRESKTEQSYWQQWWSKLTNWLNLNHT